MPDVFTPNYNLVKPEFNQSRDTWGPKLNDNFDKLDAQLKIVADSVLAGGVLKGPLTARVIPNERLTGTQTKNVDFALANVFEFTVAGTITFNLLNLDVPGEGLQLNIEYESGAFAFAGTTNWELGSGVKSTSFNDLGITFAAGTSYRAFFEIVRGRRQGIFQ